MPQHSQNTAVYLNLQNVGEKKNPKTMKTNTSLLLPATDARLSTAMTDLAQRVSNLVLLLLLYTHLCSDYARKSY
jgi:hypothetical protein